jgi:hypothetical protein
MVEYQWRDSYKAAIHELDPEQLQDRVKAAEDAIGSSTELVRLSDLPGASHYLFAERSRYLQMFRGLTILPVPR